MHVHYSVIWNWKRCWTEYQCKCPYWHIVALWGNMATYSSVIIGSGNDLLLAGTKPEPGPALTYHYPDSKVHGANMGPIWARQDPSVPHVGPMDFAIWVVSFSAIHLSTVSRETETDLLRFHPPWGQCVCGESDLVSMLTMWTGGKA